MRFSKSFIAIACTLLLLVGAAFGYSVKMLQQVRDIDRELKLIAYDIRGVRVADINSEGTAAQDETTRGRRHMTVTG